MSTRFQAHHHALVPTEGFRTLEEYCLYLIHLKAYETTAELADGMVVLDYGCNIGYGTRVLRKRCAKVIGVDVSRKAIATARRETDEDGIEFHAVNGDRLPFDDEQFNMVVSFQVIEHLSKYDAYLNEIKRVLMKNGRAVFTTPNAAIRLDPGMRPFNPFHVREFTASEVKVVLGTVFPKVVIRGLHAKEPLCQTELQRAYRNRERLRRRPYWMNALSRFVRGYLPTSVVAAVRRRISAPKSDQARLDLSAYSTADFFYADQDIDKALDLMAICSKEDD